MPSPKNKGLDEPLLEGGVSGGGAGGSMGARRGAYNTKKQQERLDALSAEERAALENSGKQFEIRSPIEEKGMGASRGAYNTKKQQERLDALSAKERAALEDVGKQFDKVNTEQKSSRSYKPTENTVLGKRELSYYELSDAQRAALTPRQRKQMGGDLDSFKKGGMAVSRRADGIAQRGKTRGKLC
jgi:hypothetical protein